MRKVSWTQCKDGKNVMYEGFFHGWGFDSPDVNCINSIAIVEDMEGQVFGLPVYYIKFTEGIKQ